MGESEFLRERVSSNQPVAETWLMFFEMSSATKEVATLSRGILNNFEMVLNIVMETPAEASYKEPVDQKYNEKPQSNTELTDINILP